MPLGEYLVRRALDATYSPEVNQGLYVDSNNNIVGPDGKPTNVYKSPSWWQQFASPRASEFADLNAQYMAAPTVAGQHRGIDYKNRLSQDAAARTNSGFVQQQQADLSNTLGQQATDEELRRNRLLIGMGAGLDDNQRMAASGMGIWHPGSTMAESSHRALVGNDAYNWDAISRVGLDKANNAISGQNEFAANLANTPAAQAAATQLAAHQRQQQLADADVSASLSTNQRKHLKQLIATQNYARNRNQFGTQFQETGTGKTLDFSNPNSVNIASSPFATLEQQLMSGRQDRTIVTPDGETITVPAATSIPLGAKGGKKKKSKGKQESGQHVTSAPVAVETAPELKHQLEDEKRAVTAKKQRELIAAIEEQKQHVSNILEPYDMSYGGPMYAPQRPSSASTRNKLVVEKRHLIAELEKQLNNLK